MFLGSPAWIGLLVIGTIAVALAGSGAAFIRADAGLALFVHRAGDVVRAQDRDRDRRADAAGAAARLRRRLPLRRRASSTETIFFLLLAPIMWFGHTVFLVRLLLGRTVGWTAQARDDHAVPWSLAARQFWPQTAARAVGAIGCSRCTVPAAIPYALFIAGGPLLSIPLAVITASPAVGRALVRIGLGRLPEETAPPPEMQALALPAIAAGRRPATRA